MNGKGLDESEGGSDAVAFSLFDLILLRISLPMINEWCFVPAQQTDD